MIVHDDTFFEDVALLALGVLAAAEAERVAEHVRSCAACRAEYASLRATADAIGYAAIEPGGVDEVAAARRKSRIMSIVRGSNGEVSDAQAVAQPPVIAIASIANNVGLRSELAQQRSDTKNLQQRTSVLDSALAELASPDSKRYPVTGGQVITHAGRVIVALRDLAPPPQGKVYQAWTLANGAKAVAPSITFRPDAGGVAVIELPQSAENLAAVAVSIEPAGGSKAPTSKPKFIRKLT